MVTRSGVGATRVTLSDRGTKDSKVEDTGASTINVNPCISLIRPHSTSPAARSLRENLNCRTDDIAISEAAAPAFLLGAIGTFLIALASRQNRVVDRARNLSLIAPEDEAWLPLLGEVPALKRRAKLLNMAMFSAVGAAMSVTILLVLGFLATLGSFPNEIGIGVFFVLGCGQFAISLILLALEVRLSIGPLEFLEWSPTPAEPPGQPVRGRRQAS